MASDHGLRRDQIHDARLVRDAEAADPGIVRPALDGWLARGEKPMRVAERGGGKRKMGADLRHKG